FTPTHRLAKEMRAKGAKAQTYHSFFRWSGQTEWTPERMGQKYIPRVIIWDEVCTVPRPILETFPDWLDCREVQVVCCGDQGQPPPIVEEMPYDWLQRRADYYEEVLADHRAKEPALKALKRDIRLQPDRVHCRAMRKALPACLGWDRFMEAWKPRDLILTSRQKIRDRAQRLLFERHEKHFPDVPVLLLYRPKDTRRQNIMVTIPGPLVLDGRPDQQELVLNDIVEVSLKYAREVLSGKWGSDGLHSPLKPRSHHCRLSKSMDYR
ncbi:MAG: AAA family ATPase, partial [Candidatus Thiodiazotropha sp.]